MNYTKAFVLGAIVSCMAPTSVMGSPTVAPTESSTTIAPTESPSVQPTPSPTPSPTDAPAPDNTDFCNTLCNTAAIGIGEDFLTDGDCFNNCAGCYQPGGNTAADNCFCYNLSTRSIDGEQALTYFFRGFDDCTDYLDAQCILNHDLDPVYCSNNRRQLNANQPQQHFLNKGGAGRSLRGRN